MSCLEMQTDKGDQSRDQNKRAAFLGQFLVFQLGNQEYGQHVSSDSRDPAGPLANNVNKPALASLGIQMVVESMGPRFRNSKIMILQPRHLPDEVACPARHHGLVGLCVERPIHWSVQEEQRWSKCP